MNDSIVVRIMFTCMFGLVLCCDASSETGEKQRVVAVKPCASISRSVPIRRECVAAAIAEDAFLHETHHQKSEYLITTMRHSTTQWKFMILGSDGTHPSAAGGDWMVFVDRSTGKVELIPGR